MTKQFVKWHTISIKNRKGEYCESDFPDLIDRVYHGELVSRILSMPPKKPIGFEDAIRKAESKWFAAIFGGRMDDAQIYLQQFVEWISDRGYHIVLTGDEFEPTRFPFRSFDADGRNIPAESNCPRRAKSARD